MGGKKKPKANASAVAHGKQPKVPASVTQSRTPFDKRVTFSFELIDDADAKFPYHHEVEASKQILDFLRDSSRLTWREVLDQRTGGKQRNHFQEIPSLDSYARSRLASCNLVEIVGEDLFRFRLDGPGRLWGHVEEGVFYPIWWDEHHEVYPVP